MNTEFLPCPFCGNEIDESNVHYHGWQDDNRYVQMTVECCVTMQASIGWFKARDMTKSECIEKLRKDLVETWNKRADND